MAGPFGLDRTVQAPVVDSNIPSTFKIGVDAVLANAVQVTPSGATNTRKYSASAYVTVTGVTPNHAVISC